MQDIVKLLEETLAKEQRKINFNKQEKERSKAMPGYSGPPLLKENPVLISNLEKAICILKNGLPQIIIEFKARLQSHQVNAESADNGYACKYWEGRADECDCIIQRLNNNPLK